jgi:hypothetical protein
MTRTAESIAHTPGPWTATYRDITEDWTIRGANGEHVASFADWDATAKHDAHLIAAAPAMLAALEKQQAVENHSLECLYCLHNDECTDRGPLIADADVARVDALITARPPADGSGER